MIAVGTAIPGACIKGLAVALGCACLFSGLSPIPIDFLISALCYNAACTTVSLHLSRKVPLRHVWKTSRMQGVRPQVQTARGLRNMLAQRHRICNVILFSPSKYSGCDCNSALCFIPCLSTAHAEIIYICQQPQGPGIPKLRIYPRMFSLVLRSS
jgi:hypothetical protein